MKKYLYSIAIMAVASVTVQAQEFDDIYYNPKKDNTEKKETKKQKPSYYIEDFSSVDVDDYNRRGQYYESPLDTIGIKAETEEDFVYTQKIQKFYNPTIVVDNLNVLDDVLVNSYGNVEVVFDNGLPYFNSIYGWPGYYNYYSWYPSWRWNSGMSWYWSPVWGFELWPNWSLGPSWTWGPSYGYWNPAFAWGPGFGWWGPTWGWGRPYYADYRPGGRTPNRPGSSWASNTRPGGNTGRPSAGRYGYSGAQASNKNGVATNYHRSYSGSSSSANRVSGTSSSRGSYSIGSDGHRRYGTTSTGSSGRSTSTTTNNHRSSSSSSYQKSSTGTSRSSSSYSTSSGSSSRSSYSGGGSYGGGRSSSGSGRSSGGSGRGRR